MGKFLAIAEFIKNENTKDAFIQTVAGVFSTLGAAFVQESIGHMIPWLIVTFTVIICDLICGVRKSICLGEEIRFSKAIRRTMGKMVTYFSFVVMICMVDVASGGGRVIDKWACLTVCFIEGCSIISNIMKPKGYDFNIIKAIGIFGKKVLNVENEDLDGIITKEDKSTSQSACESDKMNSSINDKSK